MRATILCFAILSVMIGGLVSFASGQSTEPPFYGRLSYNQRFLDNQIVTQAKPGLTLHVSSEAEPSGDGSQAAPFATLENARDAIRELKKTDGGLPAGGVLVLIAEGSYRRTEPFTLAAADSGTAESPIVYQGVKRQKVLISGGGEIDVRESERVEGDVLKRLHPRARSKVGSAVVPPELGQELDDDDQFGMVSMDGHLLTLAQWPNRGYHHIDKVIEKGPSTRYLKPGEKPPAYSKANPVGGKFTTREKLSELAQDEFQRTGRMQVEGYLHNDWFFQNESVGKIQDGQIQLLAATRYGIEDHIKNIPRRVRLVNVLAELDEPGEWYYDRADHKIYFWPINGFSRKRSKLIVIGGDLRRLAVRNLP